MRVREKAGRETEEMENTGRGGGGKTERESQSVKTDTQRLQGDFTQIT